MNIRERVMDENGNFIVRGNEDKSSKEQTILELRKEVEDLKASKEDLAERIKQYEKENKSLANAVKTREKKLLEVKKELDKLKGQKSQLLKEVEPKVKKK